MPESGGLRPGARRQPRAPRRRQPPVPVPPLLLERDDPVASLPGKPAAAGAFGGAPPSLPVAHTEPGVRAERPDSPELFVAARDPQWLYAHWDLSDEQVRHYNALSLEGHLSVRVHSERLDGQPLVEAQVLPESRHWFIYVGPGEASYVAQLGYYDQQRQWRPLAASPPVQTPAASRVVAGGPEIFATIPLDLPLAGLAPLPEPGCRAAEAPKPNAPGVGVGGLPANACLPVPLSRPALTPEQRRALGEVREQTEAQTGATSSGGLLRPEAWRSLAATG